MTPLLMFLVGFMGYLIVGVVTARSMWRVDHETIDSSRDAVGAVLGWPVVLMALAATCAGDGLHQLVTRPTKPERLEQQRLVLQRRIRQLEQDLELGDEESRPIEKKLD